MPKPSRSATPRWQRPKRTLNGCGRPSSNRLVNRLSIETLEIPSRQPGPLAFGDFLEYLRRQGFTIGVDHHLRLQRLLATLGGRCAPQDLKTLLCPVFATNEKEKALFHHVFDSYFVLF